MLDIRRRIGERSPPGRRSMSMIRRPQPTLVSLLLASVSLVGALGSSAAARTCSSTVPIACGQTLSGALSVSTETDCYQFTVAHGETVSITTQETGGGLSACWELYDPNGQSLGIACGQLEKTLAVAGGYTIRVFDVGYTKTGSFDVNLVFVSDTASNCGEAITCGQTLPRSIADVGESGTFQFLPVAGRTGSLSAKATSGGIFACWNLYDPQGSQVAGGCGQDEKKLAFAGSCTIRGHE